MNNNSLSLLLYLKEAEHWQPVDLKAKIKKINALLKRIIINIFNNLVEASHKVRNQKNCLIQKQEIDDHKFSIRWQNKSHCRKKEIKNPHRFNTRNR